MPGVGAREGLTIGCEHPGRPEPLVPDLVVPAPFDERVVDHHPGRHDIPELGEVEEEHVFRIRKRSGVDEALGLGQQDAPVDVVPAGHPLPGELPVPDERAQPIDHHLGLGGLAIPVRESAH